MVLNHVANRADGVVERAAIGNIKILSHCDLDLTNVIAVPDRLEERVREAEEEDVLNRRLAKEMVDPEDPILREDTVQLSVELLGRGKVVAERLLNDYAALLSKTNVAEMADNRAEQRRRNRKVVNRPLAAFQFVLQLDEGVVVGVIAAGVAHQRAELLEGRLVESVGAGLEARLGASAELINMAALAGDANNRHVELTVDDHPLECGEDLLER